MNIINEKKSLKNISHNHNCNHFFEKIIKEFAHFHANSFTIEEYERLLFVKETKRTY